MISNVRARVPVAIRPGLQSPGICWHCRCGEKIHFEFPGLPETVDEPGFETVGPLTVQVVKVCQTCSYCASVIWEFLTEEPEPETE